MNKKVTQKDIAEKLDISRTTVSRALNNRGRINKETRKKVLEMAKKLNYQTDKVARALARKKTFKIKIFLIEEQKFFWDKIEYGVKMARTELIDYGLDVDIYKTSINNFQKQVDMLYDLDENQVDGVIITPLNLKQLRKVIASKYKANDIPVVTLNMDIENSEKLFYVGPDYKRSGRLAAELIVKMIDYRGKVGFLTSDYNTESVIKREIGFDNKLKSYPEIKYITKKVHKLSEMYEVTRELKKEHPDIKGLVSNIPINKYFCRAIQEIKEEKSFKVVVFDFSKQTKECLKNEIVQASVIQRPFYQGYYATKLLFNYLTNKNINKLEDYYVQLDIGLKENIDTVEDINLLKQNITGQFM